MTESPRPNWASRITQYFINHRPVAIILFILLVTGGAIATIGLRREGFPKVPVKIVVVSTVYRGASPGEIEQTITNPIESAIKDVKEVKSIASTSRDNFSNVTVTLNEDSDVDAGLQNISGKVSSLTLPNEADKPTVRVPTTGGSAFVISLTGPTDYQELIDQGRIFEREVGQIKGIKQVELASDVDEQIEVLFDPAKLAAAGVDVTKIQSAITANNLNFPVGSDIVLDGSRATILLTARNADIDQLAATPLTTARGASVPLSSVATVKSVVNQNGTVNRVGVPNGEFTKAVPGLVYNVDIRSDADILLISETLAESLNRLQDNGTLHKNVTLTRLFDDAESTKRQIDEIKAGAIGEKWEGIGPLGYIGFLVGGIWLLMLAMFMFVTLRTAIIAGIAIPLSFFFTLIVLYLNGITLNTLTLFSMILVLGLVVDPAIVVLESVQRFKDLGYKPRDAVMSAVGSIGSGLILATLCSIIVFLPFGIVSGVFGEIIKFIPVTVVPALIASFFVPLIFLAPLAGRYIKARKNTGGSMDPDMALWRVSRWFKRANLFILSHVSLQIIIMLIAVIAPIAVTAYLFTTGKVQSAQFSKPHNTTEAMVTVAYPASITPDQINELARQAEEALNKHREVASYYYMQQSNTGFTIYAPLIPIKERSITSDELVEEINKQLPQDSQRQVYSKASTVSYGPPDVEFPVQLQIYEGDLAKLKDFTLDVAAQARRMPGVIRVSDGYTDASTPAIQIRVDKAAAAARGLDPATLGGQVSALIGEQNLTKLSTETATLDVIGRYTTSDTVTTAAQLRQLTIVSPTGPIKLGDIATITKDEGAGPIGHQNGQRFATVRAQVAADANAFEIQADLNQWAKDHLSEAGLGPDALTPKGEGDDIAASFVNLFQALAIAILLNYLILAVFFGSFLKPIIITFALPLAFLGVFPILAILDNEFGFLEILGLITLAGIVVNVGIFIIDYANRRVAEGMPVKEAIAQATAVRFRPIFLTKIVALGSLLPLAIFSPFWRGLTAVIIAGILTSGILSLFTTPILYTWFSKLSGLPHWIARRLHRKKAPVISS